MKCIYCGNTLLSNEGPIACNKCHNERAGYVPPDSPTGWRCPVCGAGLSWLTTRCPCVDQRIVTYSSEQPHTEDKQ